MWIAGRNTMPAEKMLWCWRRIAAERFEQNKGIKDKSLLNKLSTGILFVE
jgi:hypothetical protein